MSDKEYKKEFVENLGDYEADYEEQAAPLRESIDAFLTEHYGPRCGAYDPDCFCCKMWKHRDELLNNPFNDEPASPEWPLEVYEDVASKKAPKKKGRKRKLDTPEEIERVLRQYHLSESNLSQIARAMKVSPALIDRVLRENGIAFCEKNKDEIAEWRSRRQT